mgnify:FL=1
MGCPEESLQEPPTPGLDPIERRAALIWAVSQPDTLDSAADAAALEYGPTGVIASGAARADLAADPASGPTAAVLSWAGSVNPAFSLGVEVAPLPFGTATVCFDPADPAGDPALAGLRDGLITFLEAWPAVFEVVLDPAAGAPFWAVDCTCTPCDGLDATSLGQRYEVAWRLAQSEIAARQRIGWWFHNGPARAAEATPPLDALDAALDGGVGDLQIPVRAPATLGVDSVWAPTADRLADGAVRQVAGELDLAVSRHGPTDAVLIDAVDLQDRMRRERALGVVAWFAKVDAPDRRAHGTLEEASLAMAHSLFREFGAEARDVLGDWVAERFGLTPEGTAADGLADALAVSGRALDVATHPLGLAVLGLEAGIPGALPLSYEDPSDLDPAWAERVARLANPELQTLIDVNQWTQEGALATSHLLTAINTAAPELSAADEGLLRRRARTLDFAVRGWGFVVRADVTLRALEQGLDEPGLSGWLADDALSMNTLADDVDAAHAAGEIDDPFPVDTANLRAIATALTGATAGAAAVDRGFPVIYRLSHDFANDRTNYRWGVSPQSIGWVERGSAWPVYDDTSDVGEAPATWWTAWQNGLAADLRVTWRACAETPDGLRVCSSDQVLWTPP